MSDEQAVHQAFLYVKLSACGLIALGLFCISMGTYILREAWGK